MSDEDNDATSLDELITRFQELGEITPSDAQEIRATIGTKEEIVLPASLREDSDAMPIKEEESKDIRSKLMTMTIPQKIKLAMFGNSIARGLLIFDANKIIQEFVLKNPRLTQPEIESFLKSTTISDYALRLIAGSKAWMRQYSHKVLLVSNPKTPPDIAIKWVKFLSMTDLKKLSKSKNVPNIVINAATRLVIAAEEKH